MRSLGIVLAVALLLPLAGYAKTADTILNEIEAGLRKITKAIDDLGDASEDEADVDRVMDMTIDLLRDTIPDLAQYADDHLEAARVFEDYPDTLDDLFNALAFMKEMKAIQGQMHGAAEVCYSYERKLPQTLKRDLKDPKTTVRDLERTAKEYADEAEKLIEATEEHTRAMDNLRRSISGFRPSHREFNNAATTLKNSAQDVVDFEQGNLEEVEEACEPFVNWSRHKAFVDAKKVITDINKAIDEYNVDAKKWIADTKGIDESICESIRLIRDGYCQKDWEPGNSDALDLYDNMADSTARDFKNRLSDLVTLYERNLRDRGQTLSPRDTASKRNHEAVKSRADHLRALVYGKPLLGSNHPKLKVWRNYGVQQHVRLQNQYRCNVYEKAIPGTNGRDKPDCILLDECTIVEFKPNTPSGRADGAKVSVYASALNRWLKSEWPKYQHLPIPSRQDKQNISLDGDFILQARAWECIDDDGTALFGGDLETYDPCDRDQDLQCKP